MVDSIASPSGYAAPDTLEEALSLLAADPSNTVIAGGTDLIPGTRAGTRHPAVLVDLRRLPLAEILSEDDGLRLGARVTFADLLESREVAARYSALTSAAAEVAGPPIRNRATLGGNLVNASPAADGAPPLLVYDASVVLLGSRGRREVPLTGFFEGPGRTVLRPGEILAEIRLPKLPKQTASAFSKLGPRNAMAVSIVSAAVRIDLDGSGQVSGCRVALGAVAPTPIRATDAEMVVLSEGLSKDSLVRASAEAARATTPIDDIRASAGYRRRMIEVLVLRLLSQTAAEFNRVRDHG